MILTSDHLPQNFTSESQRIKIIFLSTLNFLRLSASELEARPGRRLNAPPAFCRRDDNVLEKLFLDAGSGDHSDNAERHNHNGIPSRVRFPRVVSTQASAVFGCLNIRSVLNKFDDVVQLCRDRHINLLCVTETWHDADSAVMGRLRNAGFNIVDRPRPRTVTDSLSITVELQSLPPPTSYYRQSPATTSQRRSSQCAFVLSLDNSLPPSLCSTGLVPPPSSRVFSIN